MQATPALFQRRRWLVAALACLGAASLQAQTRYPDKPITLIAPFAPGGIADITARTVAEVMAKTHGQTIVVDDRPSAGSIVASQAVANAKADSTAPRGMRWPRSPCKSVWASSACGCKPARQNNSRPCWPLRSNVGVT